MMGNKIEFILKKMDKAICFQITEQKLIKFRRKNIKFIIDNRNYIVEISSVSRPEISIDMYRIPKVFIYLRGNDSTSDNKIVIKKMRSNKERDIIYDIILKSFENMTGLDLTQY